MYWTFQQFWQPNAEQVMAAQLADVQSPFVAHILPLAHFCAGAQEPPQSTSVSLPLRMTSAQVGAVHRRVVAWQ
jgi:hypothetical protein